MKSTIDANRQDYYEKMNDLTVELIAIIVSMIDYIKISKSLPIKKYSPKFRDPTAVVPANKKAPPLEGGKYTKNCEMRNLKH